MKNQATDKGYLVSAVYAKCSARERRDLWDSIDNIKNIWDGPWCIGGDFNVIMDPKEKCGGNPYRASKSLDFISIMEACGLMNIGFTGPRFTWCNNRRPQKRIWKRLDRVLINDIWANDFNSNTVVQHVWETRIEGNSMWQLQSKLKLLTKRLSQWSKDSIGDINEEVNNWEAKMLILEDMDLQNNTGNDREELNKGYAEYIRWLGLQDNILRQKTQTKWFKEGDYNSRYFHCILRDRRRKLHLHRIKNMRGNWIEGDEKISRTAIKHFKNLFNLNYQGNDHRILNCIPTLITDDDNDLLNAMPMEEVIKNVVFSMNAESSAGPDGFSGKIFQFC
ncbi:uncharacterized protein LOC132631305 [Lycium barbarum]|uniref:uncharacterized protein LOC132631305 n=1 Tax=Lycium barbarum TaxID=112863 RepID=UPI00293F0E03|nr:uncharacterized protein LOC132631305 [Lycium barbarum]